MLRLLVEAAPDIVPRSTLQQGNYLHRGNARTSITYSGLRVRMCHLREALADLGMGRCIQTHHGIGFSMSSDDAASVVAAVLRIATEAA